MSDTPETPDEAPSEGGAHYDSTQITIGQLRICLEAAQLTKQFGERTAEHAAANEMTGLYLRASKDVASTSETLISALQAAITAAEKVTKALWTQGA